MFEYGREELVKGSGVADEIQTLRAFTGVVSMVGDGAGKGMGVLG